MIESIVPRTTIAAVLAAEGRFTERERKLNLLVTVLLVIITNAHVAGRDALKVKLPDGRILPARVLAHDAGYDLAALSVDADALPTIELGNAKHLQPGQWVLALGHPWGVSGAVTAGVVINTGPPPEIPARGEFIQVGLRLRPGHSGGPLVDVHRRLVGINTMITGPEVGLAIPVHVVKNFLRDTLGSARDGIRDSVYGGTFSLIDNHRNW